MYFSMRSSRESSQQRRDDYDEWSERASENDDAPPAISLTAGLLKEVSTEKAHKKRTTKRIVLVCQQQNGMRNVCVLTSAKRQLHHSRRVEPHP